MEAITKEYIEKTLALQERWEKIRIANISDSLYTQSNDKWGHQVVHHTIKSIRTGERQHIAGRAITVRGIRSRLTREEIKSRRNRDYDNEVLESLLVLKKLIYPGSVIVIDAYSNDGSAKLGEFMSWLFKNLGAKGVFIDGLVRDSEGLLDIPDFGVFCRGITSIDSDTYWHAQHYNEIISLTGQLINQVRVAPGDWVIGGSDGVVVVPKEIEEEILTIAERLEVEEIAMREAIYGGMSWQEAFDKYHRK